jgi:hypothetical protein
VTDTTQDARWSRPEPKLGACKPALGVRHSHVYWSEILSILDKFKKMLCTFERRRIDPNRLHGVIVSKSDSLVLLHHVYDLGFDGYKVIRRSDITKEYSSDSDAYNERLMRKEGLWKKSTKVIRSLPVDNWHVLLSAFAGKLVEIENERQGDFCIGPIVALDPHSVSIHHFDACGQWCDIKRISLRTITLISFGDRYGTVHFRNLPRRPKW